MPATPKFALRYPASTDSPDVPRDIQNLATDVETALGPGTAPVTGIQPGEAQVWDGSTWGRSSVTRLGIASLAGYPADGTKYLAGDGTWKTMPVPPAAPVTTVFGRAGAVAAQAGDYSAAQVTNAADKATSGTQVFTGAVWAAGLGTNPAPGGVGGGSNGVGLYAGGFAIFNTGVGANIIYGTSPGDSQYRMSIDSTGTIHYGSGAAAPDCFFGRSGAGTLTCGAALIVQQSLTLQGPAYLGNNVQPSFGSYVGGPTTITPDATIGGTVQTYRFNAPGTATINPPSLVGGSSTLSRIIYMEIRNTSGSGPLNIQFNAVYAGSPGTALAAGQGILYGFIWSPWGPTWLLSCYELI
jgi:hypothetical protein